VANKAATAWRRTLDELRGYATDNAAGPFATMAEAMLGMRALQRSNLTQFQRVVFIGERDYRVMYTVARSDRLAFCVVSMRREGDSVNPYDVPAWIKDSVLCQIFGTLDGITAVETAEPFLKFVKIER